MNNIEVKVKGFLKTALSAEESTAVIDVDFVNEDDSTEVIELQSDTLRFDIDPLNKTGKGSELILATSNTFDSPIANRTRLATVTRGLEKFGAGVTGSATRAKSWDVGTEVSIATGSMAKVVNDHTTNKVDANVADTVSARTSWSGTNASPNVPSFADSTARDAAMTSPLDGDMCTVGGDLQHYNDVTVQWETADTGTPTPNGSTTVAGKYEEATVAEQGTATATGSTGARLIPANANLVKTSSGAGDENKIAILEADGKFADGFQNISEANATELTDGSTTTLHSHAGGVDALKNTNEVFITNDFQSYTNSGTGTFSNHGGLVSMRTGSTINNALQTYTQNVLSSTGYLSVNAKMYVSCRFNGLATIADTMIGFSPSFGYIPINNVLTHDHAAFLIDGSTLIASVADGTTQSVSSTITCTLTDMNNFAIEDTGSSWLFYLNGSLVATLTTNMPNSNMPSSYVGIKTVTAEDRTLYVGGHYSSMEL